MSDKDTKPRYYTPEEMAERLSVSPAMIRKMINAGKITAAKFGSLWRIPIEEVARFERDSIDTPEETQEATA